MSAGLVGEFVVTASAAGQPASTLVQLRLDSDGDGVGDFRDNAILVANPDQRDTDGDGYGNITDADLNQDQVVDLFDLSILDGVYGSNDANADFNGDGTVDLFDLSILDGLFDAPPGLSYVDNQVASLVAAMASFAPSAAGLTTLPPPYQTSVNPVIAANWQ